MARASSYRSSGSLASALPSTSPIPGSASSARASLPVMSSVVSLNHSPGMFSASNSPSEVTISYSTDPSENRSDRCVSGPSHPSCSGDMYRGVPLVTDDWVVLNMLDAALAMPKSSSFARPWAVTMMLLGLRSRWIRSSGSSSDPRSRCA